MKKILLTSTAMVAFAGAASAEVLISGLAEMGIQYGDGGVAATDNTVEFFTDIDVTFTMTGETDGGLVFGADIDLDESDGSDRDNTTTTGTVDPGPDGILGTDDDSQTFDIPGSTGGSPAFNDRTQGGEAIFISGGFGTLTAGDTDGAIDWALTEVAFASGSINDDETEHAGYNGNAALDGTFDGQILRYDYSVGDFGVALSAEIDDGDTDQDEASSVLGIGFKYGVDLGGGQVSFGIGYQAGENFNDNDLDDPIDDVEAIGASLNGTFGAFTAGLSYLNVDAGDSLAGYDHYGIGVGYVTGAISLSANYGDYDFDNGTDQDGYGITAGYDLGGGAAVQFGYGDSNFSDADDFETMSFGVALAF